MSAGEELSFEEWMQEALHAPGRGYYAARLATVGRHGDFSTSATISNHLGEAIAHWLKRRLAGIPGVSTVIEAGGGDGSLSHSVRKALGWWLRRRVSWIMVETSAVLKEQQQVKLGSSAIHWFTGMKEALAACEGSALIFHNELLDAFPVQVVQWNPSTQEWQQLRMQREGTTWHEALRPWSPSTELRERFSAITNTEMQPNTTRPLRIELAVAARSWLEDWMPQWKSGEMLTIDYGDILPALYHRRPQGTLRAYIRQQCVMGTQVYEYMGRQDITADVNFTDLLNWGDDWGLQHEPLLTQRDFLLRETPRLASQSSSSQAAAYLVHEHGAGAAFKVLVQRRASAPSASVPR